MLKSELLLVRRHFVQFKCSAIGQMKDRFVMDGGREEEERPTVSAHM